MDSTSPSTLSLGPPIGYHPLLFYREYLMEFVHRAYQSGETIAAIATPPGEGGVAVVRISGNDAIGVAEKIFSGPVRSYQTHTAHFGKIVDSDGSIVDEALALVMIAPRSYTGEDTVEIHCHGGSLISKRVLDTILKAGARAGSAGRIYLQSLYQRQTRPRPGRSCAAIDRRQKRSGYADGGTAAARKSVKTDPLVPS